MLDVASGKWLMPPPNWPPLFNKKNSNLNKFWSMNSPEELQECSSEILITEQLRDRFLV